jgi:FAD/FMN-containing dehydrogenase
VLRATAKRNGSISAEHGLGLMKAPYVGYSKTEPAIAVMQQIRRLFDPRGILSPAKYLPQASELPFQSEEERVQ